MLSKGSKGPYPINYMTTLNLLSLPSFLCPSPTIDKMASKTLGWQMEDSPYRIQSGPPFKIRKKIIGRRKILEEETLENPY